MDKYFIKTNLIGFIIIGCLLSCTIHKTVVLTPIEPFEYNEFNIIFSIPIKSQLYIQFDADAELYPMPFRVSVQSNEELEQVYLKSISLNINELNIKIEKENIMIPIINKGDMLKKSEYYFNGYIEPKLFETQEIQNNIFPKPTNRQLHNKFKNVKEIEFVTTIIYNINGQDKESAFIWNFRSKKNTELITFIDVMMGV
jgi:hypothetical protein